MPSDDPFGGLLDRETVLAGLPARRANTLLYLIESRTAHLVARSREAMELFLSEENAQQRKLAFLEAFALGSEPPLRPTIRDLERYAPQWAPLVPENPRVQASVAHRLGEKYRFTYESAPGIRAALGLDDAAVQQAYRRLYGQPIESIFAARATPGERLRWAWAGLARWLENLPPFWTAYALTLTETVGVTILALPIAVAGIGPLAGVVLLAVLGVINVLTIAFLSEAVARSGAIRYGSGFIGKVVDDYLGRAGSLVLSLGIFVLCFLALQAYYIGFASALEGATRVSAVVWVVLLFLAGLYFLRRESLSATVASALVVGAVNVVLVVVLSLVAFTHLRPENFFHVDVPLLGGRPLEPAILGLVFGVILAAYFGHLSVSTCARVVLRRDPGARSLVWGAAAAQATVIILYCLFVLAVNGAIAPQVLAGERGTALDPLATEIGPIVYLLGSVFVVLGMGMASIQFTLVLFNLVRERLPSVARPVVVLPRRRGVLLFHERGRGGAGTSGLRLGVFYLGLSGGKARFRLDVELDGGMRRVETTAVGRWEVLGEESDPALLGRLPELRDRGDRLVLEVMEADQQRVRVQVISSMRPSYEGVRDAAGLDLADVFALPDSRAEIIGWMIRQGKVGLTEVAQYTGQDEEAALALLEELAEQGFVAEQVGPEGAPSYEARLATRRGRQGSVQVWQALGEEGDSPSGTETLHPSRTSGVSGLLRRVSSSEHGSFVLGASPVAVAFLLAEWLLLTGSGSFTGLLSLIGVLIVPLLSGIFPVLMLVASRRKGERVPQAVYRFLGNPLLLAGIYVLFLASIFLHGLVIWSDPLQRAIALLVGVLVVGMSLAMRGAFARRLVVELREDEDGRALFSVTADGRPAATDVQLRYPKGEQRHKAAAGEVPAFSSLCQATFRPEESAATQLKVWAHKVTPEGDSEGIAGSLHVRQGDKTEEFDLKLSKGQVVLQVAPGTCQVDITLAEASDTRPGDSF
jgi:amino acid permease